MEEPIAATEALKAINEVHNKLLYSMSNNSSPMLKKVDWQR
jgi:hypothetical protein